MPVLEATAARQATAAGPRLRARWRLVCSALVTGLAAISAGAQPAADCHIPGIRNSVLCGVVQRPLDPSRPQGTQIDVHYIVVPAMARNKLPDPVFLLAGGPGQSAIGVAPDVAALFARIGNRRDVVFVDQRGTGRSAPLECGAPKLQTLAQQSDPDEQFDLMMQCKAELLRLPFIKSERDLGFFTTALAAQDLDAVRAQWGAARINLVGVSYGTRLALEYMRQYPGAVRRTVLDAVVPPDMVLPQSFSPDSQAALDAMLSACERQAECAGAYPRLRQDWQALLAGLPRSVLATHPLSGSLERFTLSRDMVLGAVRGALYAPSMAAALPDAITQAAAGRYDPLMGVGSLLNTRKGIRLSMGMHFSVICAEDVPRLADSGDAPGADFGTAYATLYARVCGAWPRGAVPQDFYRIPPTHTPTLLLSGGLDPAAPPRHGARVAAALGPAAQHVVVANAGHGVLGIGCARDLLYRFIQTSEDSDASKIDASCLGGIPRPGVFRPIHLLTQATN